LNACGGKIDDDQKLLDDARVASIPRRIAAEGVTDVVKVDIGYTGMIFLTRSGGVFTCDTGFNGYAQTNPDARIRIVRRIVFDTDAAVDVAAGRCHFVAAARSGAAYTWGCPSDALGRVPTDSADAARPTPITTDIIATHVAAGEHFTLILAHSGEIYGVGAAGDGALGVQPSGAAAVRAPVRVAVEADPAFLPPPASSTPRVRAITAGYQHAVAILQY
jgi:regulator of chromosome condensation